MPSRHRRGQRARSSRTGVAAGPNAPRQTVVSGEARAAAVVGAEAAGGTARCGPVSFHCRAAAAGRTIGRRLRTTFRPLTRRVHSTIAGRALGNDDLRALLPSQCSRPCAHRAFEVPGEVDPGIGYPRRCSAVRREPVPHGDRADAGGPSLAGWLRALGGLDAQAPVPRGRSRALHAPFGGTPASPARESVPRDDGPDSHDIAHHWRGWTRAGRQPAPAAPRSPSCAHARRRAELSPARWPTIGCDLHSPDRRGQIAAEARADGCRRPPTHGAGGRDRRARARSELSDARGR
jgi:hypothetical protein